MTARTIAVTCFTQIASEHTADVRLAAQVETATSLLWFGQPCYTDVRSLETREETVRVRRALFSDLQFRGRTCYIFPDSEE